jgi:hypothetical protein
MAVRFGAIPSSLSGVTDQVLKVNSGGTGFEFASVNLSGVSAVGALDAQTKNSNGATIVGNTVYLQTASGTTYPGLISTGTQVIGGEKIFTSPIGGTISGSAVLTSEMISRALYLDASGTIKSHIDVTNTELGYLSNVTSDIQTQLNGTVKTTGNQTISGTKTFASTITGDISGNAGTVTSGVYTYGTQAVGGTKTFSNTVYIDGNLTPTGSGTSSIASPDTQLFSVYSSRFYTENADCNVGTRTDGRNLILVAGAIGYKWAILGSDGTLRPSTHDYNLGGSSYNVGTAYIRNITCNDQSLVITAPTSTNLYLGAGGSDQWLISAGGNFYPVNSGTQIIGNTTYPVATLTTETVYGSLGQDLVIGAQSGRSLGLQANNSSTYRWYILTDGTLRPNSSLALGSTSYPCSNVWSSKLESPGYLDLEAAYSIKFTTSGSTTGGWWEIFWSGEHEFLRVNGVGQIGTYNNYAVWILANNAARWVFAPGAPAETGAPYHFRPTTNRSQICGTWNYHWGTVWTEEVSASGIDLYLSTVTSNNIRFYTAATHRWSVDTSGHFRTSSDGGPNVGASSSTGRPERVHVKTAITVNGTALSVPFTSCHRYTLASGTDLVEGSSMVLNEENQLCFSTTASAVDCVGLITSEVLDGQVQPESDLFDSFQKAYVSGTNIYHVAAAGDSRSEFIAGARISNINGPVNKGDLLVTSTISGYLMKQDDDIFRSCTVGKCMEDVEFDVQGVASGIYIYLYCG